MQILKGRKLILGSKSPRRAEILEKACIPFEIVVNEVEEIYPDELEAHLVPSFLAKLKASVFKETVTNNQIVLTSDTIVILDGAILGKPKDRQQAIEYLTKMSGRTHRVITAVHLLSKEKSVEFYDESLVSLAQLSPQEIEWYIDHQKPYDKAGAYGIQDWIGFVKIDKIEGSYATIMGLPIAKVYEALKDF